MKKQAKKTVGAEIVERLREFVEALERGADIRKEFRCRRVEVPAQPSVPDQVKATRKILHVSQHVFARFLGISVETVRAWEKGTEQPAEMACRFMEEMRLDPDHWRKRIRALTSMNGRPVK